MRHTRSQVERVSAHALPLLLALATLLSLGVLPVETAAADPGPVVQRAATGVTADALPTVQIDGVVWDQQIVGDTVYAGGEFANARPAGAAPGTNLTPRSNLLAYDIRTGVLNPSFAPTLNAQVKTIAASPDGKRLYVGGSFTTVNGVSRSRIAAFDTATGALVSSFAPAVNLTVNAIAVTADTVYVGGAFTAVGSVARSRLAAFSPTTGALLGWAPAADRGVNALLVTPDGSRVLAAGSFGTVNGATATGLAALGAGDASLLPWAANTVVHDYGSSAAMLSLSTDGTSVYSTGYWYGGTGNFEGVLAADPNTGAIKWLADCHGDTYDATPMNGIVYAVSHWHHCGNIGGFPDTNPRSAWYRADAVTSKATGTVAHNSQGGYHDFYGQPAPSLVNWFPDMPAGSYTGQTQAGWTTTSNADYLLQGGEFPSVNGVGQQGLVRFALSSSAAAPRKQGPRVSGTPSNPSVAALSSSSVRITWPANWDRDDQSLTYSLTRGTATTASTEIFTTKAVSQFWNRPTMAFVDTTVKAGGTYKYRLSATDPDGNKVQSDIVNVTVPSTTNPYVAAVLGDGASSYWRMSGTRTFPDLAGTSDLTAAGGVTAGTSGAVTGDSDGSATFDGSTGVAATRTAVPGPDTFTAEAWFRTTSSAGGKILGFGSASTGSSGSYDRHVYLDSAGRVVFGVYNGRTSTLRTPTAYNDGQWHQVAAELSSAGMALYVDGAAVDTSPVSTGQAYSGYWRVGQDNLNGWPDQPSSSFFGGSIDEVAIYPTALTSAQVRDHYARSGRTAGGGNASPLAAFASDCTAAACSFDGSGSSDPDGSVAAYAWDFGDGANGTGRTATRTYASTGTYPVTLTVTDDAGATRSTTKQVVVSSTVAGDTFSRSVTRWGSADQGGAWTYSGSTFSTNGRTGDVRLATAGSGATASLASVSQRDLTVVADVALDSMATGGGTSTTLLTRRIGTSDYRMTLKQLPAGAVRLNLTRVVNQTATSLKDVSVSSLTYAAGDVLRLRFDVTGSSTTTLSGKVWHVGSGEPASAQITATDATPALQAAGSFGVYCYLSGSATTAPVTVSVDNLSMTAG